MTDKRKNIYKIYWGVNQYRTDKRTGAIDPMPRSKYMKKLFKEEEERLK
ncbi:hypothetical protein [Rossellomorea sp. BNER]|nr:hypothetical protein [Rossellomorea sp. BNER]